MAEQQLPGLNREQPMISAYGNVSVYRKTFTIPAAYSEDDTILIGRLPNGAHILDAVVITEGGAGASSLLDLGFQPVAGGETTYDDADALLAGADLHTAEVVRRSNTAVRNVTLDDDYYLEGTINGADVTVASEVEVQVYYEFTGTP